MSELPANVTELFPETPAPDLSIVIPVYNEEAIIYAAVAGLTERLDNDFGFTYELILSENGSKDRTLDIARQLQNRHSQVRILHSDVPDYGLALKRGIEEARGAIVICDEIDLCDTDFYRRALAKIQEENYDMVVGSKAMEGAKDKRPPLRRFATSVINLMLKVGLGFQGTDTHGLKAFNREQLLPVARRCVVGRDLFASEFVIRAQRERYRLTEVPIELEELRAPSVKLTKRVPAVLKGIGKLIWVIRVRNR
ncbi:MAG: glycosyl transferase family 2 [Deltaproteobacteria bacterium CG17_big_fil_post_rev_8_21_14_2_50_63_7]|nr:MAG: glycosyl transferase family 2 [Deltaproteobacteria bacterium CG17_big_fil_post_rev_8_21_14_2_50_63_7]